MSSHSVPDLTVVGIGASAGGLGALRSFFSEVPASCELTFVVVVHLDPDHESHLADLLQREAALPVIRVSETVRLEPGHVYVIPPNASLEAVDTHLRLAPLEKRRSQRTTVDHFLVSLAAEHGSRSVAIILTGTGSDGALGVRAIREAGGFTIAQAPEDAEHEGMPMNAVATGKVDLVLPLREIPRALKRLAHTVPDVRTLEERELSPAVEKLVRVILSLMQARTGRNFQRYKRSTVLRRIARRMQLGAVEELAAYVELLRERPEEIDALANELVVNLTSFFRDPQVFETLARDVLPGLFARKQEEDEIRLWTVGCATGEEAYSLAMLLLEEASRHDLPPRIQIFASDLHEASLQRGREGFYPSVRGVSVERLERFFDKEVGGHRIKPHVRELVVFAAHDLLADPPFSRLDLVACRNLLIYLRRDAQREVLGLFHYALGSGGLLVLGTSETTEPSDLFVAVDKPLRIYQRRNVPAPEPRLEFFGSPRAHALAASRTPQRPGNEEMYGVLHHLIVESYAPPSLLVGPDDRVVHVSEHAGRFLVVPGGSPTEGVLKLVRDELRLELALALDLARSAGKRYRSIPVPVRFNGEAVQVVLEVRPALESRVEGFVVVVFHEGGAAAERGEDLESALSTSGSERDEERASLAERYRLLSERYETSREEMRSANEELQSANEELRATLEELETSKEELQSINEELQTANQENRHRVDELAQLSSDLKNLMAASRVATLFLDRGLRIVRFTPRLVEIFNVRETDRGRQLSDITHRLGYEGLESDAATVLESLETVEREVDDKAGNWYLMRVLPYRSSIDRIEGVVVTFVDITTRKQAEEQVHAAMRYAEEIVEGLPEPILVLDADLRVSSANKAYYLRFQADPASTVGTPVHEIEDGRWSEPSLRQALEAVAAGGKGLDDHECEGDFPTLGHRIMRICARRIAHERKILVCIHDVTEQRLALRRLEEADKHKEDFLAVLSHELRNPLAALRNGIHLLQADAGEPAAVERTRRMMARQTDQLVQLIDDLLDINRIKRGSLRLRIVPTDVTTIVRRALEICQSTLQDRRLEVDFPPHPVPIEADPPRLAQVFTNLLHNAWKFTEPGGSIRIAVEESGGEVRIRVSDDGAGIESDLLPQVFEMFTQARAARSRSQGGLGLGLSIVRRLAELHGGAVEVHSEGPGRGSQFVVSLPVAEGGPLFAPQGTPSGTQRVYGLRILVVDDNRDSADSLTLLLRSAGANELSTVYGGLEAVATVAAFRPDVIVLDLGLPDLDGYEVARRIRRQPGGGDMLLVALTGWGQESDRTRSREAGIDHHLVKPVDLESLWGILATRL